MQRLRLACSLVVTATALLLFACKQDGGGRGGRGPSAALEAQGWTGNDAVAWLEGTQGSRLLPYSWWKALEQPEADQPFTSPAFLASFGFEVFTSSSGDLRPLGIALDQQDDTPLVRTKLRWFAGQDARELWIGVNCAACHTGRLSYRGSSVRIMGGPSLLDYQRFVETLHAALSATRSDSAKWSRFAARVLQGNNNPQNQALLRSALDRLIASEAPLLNATPSDASGPGRVDMLGHMFSAVQYAVGAQGPVHATTAAPVSYPFLWDAYRQSQWQYDGIARPAQVQLGAAFYDFGAAGRDTGEMLGAFGEVVVPDEPGAPFSTSLRAAVLTSANVMIHRLSPPRWPGFFGALDARKVEAGRALYDRRGCVGCHPRAAPGPDVFQVHMLPQTPGNRNNTDAARACLVASYTGRSGKLAGRRIIGSPPLRATENGTRLLSTVVTAALASQLGEGFGRALEATTGSEAAETQPASPGTAGNACPRPTFFPIAYKARPLEGAWATAPFLHNGSVPTLYDLLLPPAQRPVRFFSGTREFDPVKVGFVTAAGAPGNRFQFDTSAAGNSNQGHDFGNETLTEQDRLALVEYLKSL